MAKNRTTSPLRCLASRPTSSHAGFSQFGEKVIARDRAFGSFPPLSCSSLSSLSSQLPSSVMHAQARYRSRSPRPPPLPQSPRPTISVTKPKAKNASASGTPTSRLGTPRLSSRPSSPEFAPRSPRPPPVPRTPRPVPSPVLKKSSRNDRSVSLYLNPSCL